MQPYIGPLNGQIDRQARQSSSLKTRRCDCPELEAFGAWSMCFAPKLCCEDLGYRAQAYV